MSIVRFPHSELVESVADPRVLYIITIAGPDGPCNCTCPGWQYKRECRHVALVLRDLTQAIQEGALVELADERCARCEHPKHGEHCDACDPFARFDGAPQHAYETQWDVDTREARAALEHAKESPVVNRW